MFALVFAVPFLVLKDARGQSLPTPTEAKAAFLRLLDRPKVPLDPKTKESLRDGKGLIAERVEFSSEKHPDGIVEHVPALVVRPEVVEGKRPAVIVLHGTGGNKEGGRSWLDDLAKRGIIGIAIDGRFHGERAGGAKGAEAYNAAIVRAWKSKPGEPQTHPLYLDTCWDVWRTVDYLQSRPDVDPDRIGLIGISKGGIETWLAASVDDRIKVAVPAISVQSFRWSLDNDQWQGRARTINDAHLAAARSLGKSKVDAEVCKALWTKIIPGMLDQFDCPNLLPLFAGRALLIINGELDPNCPIEGAEVAFESARKAFKKAKADDKLKISVAKGVGHAVTPEQRALALDWFVRWLKP